MRMQWRWAGAALALGLLGSGCVSFSQVQTADTLGAGRFQLGLEPGAQPVEETETESDGTRTVKRGYAPLVDLSLRYGVTERLDLGARIGSSSLELQSKILLTSPENESLAISLAPSASGIFAAFGPLEAGYLRVSLPLLIGIKTRGGSELVFGPRLDGRRFLAGAGEDTLGVNILNAGASVGYALRVSEGFRLLPEVAYSRTIAGSAEANGATVDRGVVNAPGIWQFRLGFLFGQGRPSLAASGGDTRYAE
ncbi:hypothetical protein [Archangium primigenium]|uniref:hypothetical protein n=1 Tax=[Archangium] primigenium TaxID=2792470 RepID=UPI001957D225|nr:hypothetical protein [Archangium primigenium]MBM7113052.1 hypothetical protein [Archangium primigenium]